VRDRVRFEHLAFSRQRCLELIEQARLACTCLRHDSNDLAVSTYREIERVVHLLKLAFTPDESGQPAPSGEIEMVV